MSAYQTLKTVLENILPEGWGFKGYEPIDETPDAVTLTMKVRSVTRLPAAPLGGYQVTWVLTITTDLPSRESADPELFDDLIDFLSVLDTDPSLSWLGWSNAEKVAAGEEFDRLAYDITLITTTTKEEA